MVRYFCMAWRATSVSERVKNGTSFFFVKCPGLPPSLIYFFADVGEYWARHASPSPRPRRRQPLGARGL